MKIGDKVRFLSETGGGIVCGFDKGNVIVRDADGFEIPMPKGECIVIDTDNYNRATQHSADIQAPTSQDPAPQTEDITTIVLKPEERLGGDTLNVYLAFLPMQPKEMTSTRFETYIVNDSNYTLDFLYMSAEDANWRVRFKGTVDANTKMFVEEFGHEDIDGLNRVCLQLIAYKADKPFALKQPVSAELRIDGVKFYKAHCFKTSPFFDDDALIYNLAVNDKAARSFFVDAAQLQDALLTKRLSDQRRAPAPARKQEKQKPQVIEVDLHINQLLDNTNGLSNKDMLDCQLREFNRIMKENEAHKGQKIVFIHGKGEGVLRAEIIKELKRAYKHCSYQDASFCEYGFGATLVTIH